MKSSSRFSQVALVDSAITNARNAGHEPDQTEIAFYWKIARGEVSMPEIESFFRHASKSIHRSNAARFGHLTFEDVNLVELTDMVSKTVGGLKGDLGRIIVNSSAV